MPVSVKKTTDYDTRSKFADTKPEQQSAKVVSMPTSDYPKAVQFINTLISTSCKKTEDIKFSYGNKTAQIQEFNTNLDKKLTETLPLIQSALEQGLKLQLRYSDSEKTMPHSLGFIDHNGKKQGPAVYNYPPNFSQPVSIGILQYQDDKIIKEENMTYDPIKEYARAVHNKSEQLAQNRQKSDLEHPTPYVPEPSITDKLRRKAFFLRKKANREVINPVKEEIIKPLMNKIKNVFRS